MNHEVYLRARLADEEKRLEPGMKAAIAWALEEIATWRGMWEVAKRPNRLDVPFEWCEAAYRALNDGK